MLTSPILQHQDENGTFIVKKAAHNWILQAHDTWNYGLHQVGYYNIDDPMAPQVYDLRDFSAVAIWTYIDGSPPRRGSCTPGNTHVIRMTGGRMTGG